MLATEGIIEVAEVGQRACNDLLANGYRLLAVEAYARGVERRPVPGEGLAASFWVAKGISYVVGRTAGQLGVDNNPLPPIHAQLAAWAEQRRQERAAANVTSGDLTSGRPTVRDEG